MMSGQAGRSCPISYRYTPENIAAAPEEHADVLYVIGGLYGNSPALAYIEQLAASESSSVKLVFNGDFNWFNCDPNNFNNINQRVLSHSATRGNVETELSPEVDEAGCGCAYPNWVDDETVQRSNNIMSRLQECAGGFPELTAQLADLPMFRRINVGGIIVGIVHGDAESLSGWGFSQEELQYPDRQEWLLHCFDRAEVDVFASSHSCLPALWSIRNRVLINNGAAGMPNFKKDLRGLISRVSNTQHPNALYSREVGGVYIEAIPVAYHQANWENEFLKQWPVDSDAYESYYQRIQGGPDYELSMALWNAL